MSNPPASNSSIDSTLQENRVFAPPSAAALGIPGWLIATKKDYLDLHRRSIDDPEGFWLLRELPNGI